MMSHDLAHFLLSQPDMVVGLNVYGHGYDSEWHRYSHGSLCIFMDKRSITISTKSYSGDPIKPIYVDEEQR